MTKDHNPQPAIMQQELEPTRGTLFSGASIAAVSKATSTDEALDLFFTNSGVQGAYPEIDDTAAWQWIATILSITGADRGPWGRMTPAQAVFLQLFNKSLKPRTPIWKSLNALAEPEFRLRLARINNWYGGHEKEVEDALSALRSTPECWREWSVLVEGKLEKVTIQWFYDRTEIVGIIKGPADKQHYMTFHKDDLGEPWKRTKQLIKGYWGILGDRQK